MTYIGGGGSTSWGDIGGSLSTQTDLQSALNSKQASGSYQTSDADLTTIASINSTSSGALASDGAGWILKTYAALKTALGLGNVVNADTTTTANIADSTNKRFVTDANLTVIGNTSGTNTGDQVISDATISTTDITTNNATTSKHGFLQKLPGGTATFLRADGTFSAPTASVAIYQTEVDFGSVPLKMKKFTVTDAGVTSSMKIIPTLSYDNPSDGEVDSAEWFEDMDIMARADTGQFFLYCNSPYQDLTGKVKINYVYA